MSFDNICKLNFLLIGIRYFNGGTDHISKDNLKDKELVKYLENILENYEVD